MSAQPATQRRNAPPATPTRKAQSTADLEQTDREALQHAVTSVSFEDCSKLIRNSVNPIEAYGLALHHAVRKFHTEELIVNLLTLGKELEASQAGQGIALLRGWKGRDKETIASENQSALLTTANYGKTAYFHLLRSHGVDARPGIDDITVALSRAGSTELLEGLIEEGLLKKDRLTALLHFASDAGETETALMLHARGATLGVAALDAAARRGHLETALAFVERGVRWPENNRLWMWAVSCYCPREHFFVTADKILDCAAGPDPVAALSGVCGTDLSALKGDAFQGEKAAWHQQNFVKVALRSALVSGLLSYELQTPKDEIFRNMIRADIEHVEQGASFNWSEYALAQGSLIGRVMKFEHAVKEISDAVVFPQLVQSEVTKQGRFYKSDIHRTQSQARSTAERLIADGKSSLELLMLNQAWRTSNADIPPALQPLKRDDWIPLIEPCRLSAGYSITAPRSPHELRVASEALQLGLDSFSRSFDCGFTSVLLINRKDTPVAAVALHTNELGSFLTPQGQLYQQEGFYGHEGEKPGPAVKMIWHEFLAKVRAGEVIFHSEQGLTEETRNARQIKDTPAGICGYPLDQTGEMLPRLLAHYRENVTVPGRNGTCVSLIEHTDISRFVPDWLRDRFAAE